VFLDELSYGSIWKENAGVLQIISIYFIKGIGSILFLKNGLKKNYRKNSINHLRRNNYEVYTVIVRCFPNILNVMVLENI
jgi:ABC-type arginine transport system permease subunit